MMTDLNFRPAAPDDIEALITMMRDLYAHDGTMAFNEEIARRALLGVIGDAALGRVFLILVANEVAGYAGLTFGYSLEFHGRDAFVDEIYLRDEYRGQGIGKRALQFLTEVCAKEGVNALHLEVERENTSAQAVYRKFGFEDHDRYLMTKWVIDRSAEKA
ncbi:MAG: GNAT family N-acetyltransferase [Blastocatellia bacterium]